MTTNWNKVLIRSSSLSILFTEPKAKADKEAGKLSKTAKSHLVKVYAKEFWGVDIDVVTKQIKKGIMCEEEAIQMLSQAEGILYEKNDERKENQWITGHADVVEGHEIIDTKCSYDALTFLSHLVEPLSDEYEAQMQGYLWLWEKDQGRVCHVLVDTPDSIIEGEKYSLLRAMDVATEENPDFIRAWERKLTNLKFNHIPLEQRIITYHVKRNEEFIAQIPAKVERAREFLAELHEIHMKII